MDIEVQDGRGVIATVRVYYDTNGTFVAVLIRSIEGRQLSCGQSAVGPTIQDAFNNLKALVKL